MSSYFNILPGELLDELLEYLTKSTLLAACSSISPLYRKKCIDQEFWRRKLFSNFPLNKLSEQNKHWLTKIATDTSLTNTETPFGWDNLYKFFTAYDRYINPIIAENISPRYIMMKTLDYAKVNKLYDLIDEILINDPLNLSAGILLNPKTIDVVTYIFNKYPEYQRPLLMSLLTTNTKLNKQFLNSDTYKINKKRINELLSYDNLSEFFTEMNFGTAAGNKKILMEHTDFYDGFTDYLNNELYKNQAE